MRCRHRPGLVVLRPRRSRSHQDPVLLPEDRRRASGGGGAAADAAPVTAREAAHAIWEAALAAADVRPLIRRSVRRVDAAAWDVAGARVEASPGGRVLAIGCGKASAAMAAALEDVLGDR